MSVKPHLTRINADGGSRRKTGAAPGQGRGTRPPDAGGADVWAERLAVGESVLRPIDMPHDDLASYKGFDDATRERLARLVADAYAAGRWRASEDMLWNPHDPQFIAYWAQK